MKNYDAYIHVSLKVVPRVHAYSKADAEEKIGELSTEELLKNIVDFSGFDIYNIMEAD